MLLIAGLGNPGPRYEATRHNVGFMLLDRLSEAHGISCTRKDPLGVWGEGAIVGSEVVLLKPLTYMNRSGDAVLRFSTGMSIDPASIVVAYDDVDLPLGRLRIRKKGGSGGHRGLGSIIERLGTRDFPRIRLGVGKPDTGEVSDHVLSPFAEGEHELLEEMLTRGTASVEAIITEGIDRAMTRFNRA